MGLCRTRHCRIVLPTSAVARLDRRRQEDSSESKTLEWGFVSLSLPASWREEEGMRICCNNILQCWVFVDSIKRFDPFPMPVQGGKLGFRHS